MYKNFGVLDVAHRHLVQILKQWFTLKIEMSYIFYIYKTITSDHQSSIQMNKNSIFTELELRVAWCTNYHWLLRAASTSIIRGSRPLAPPSR